MTFGKHSERNPRRAHADSAADVAVVGAGSAGVVVAARLAAAGARVVLLEAGGWTTGNPDVDNPLAWFALLGTALDWSYSTEPVATVRDRRFAWPRGKAVGGSSSINAMAYVRGTSGDFDQWEQVAGPGWAYREVLPLFLRTEDWAGPASPYHGVGGELRTSPNPAPTAAAHAFVNAAVRAGFDRIGDFNGATQFGAGLLDHTIRDGVRESVSHAFFPGGHCPLGLSVITGAHATRLLLDGTRCRGVEYVHDGAIHRVKAPETVVCAGAIESPKLLMLSGVGPAGELTGHGIEPIIDLPVGRNLHDHVHTLVSVRSDDPRLPRPVPLPEAAVFCRIGQASSPAVPDLQLCFVPLALNASGQPPDRGFTLMPILARPRSRGSITLRSADPQAAPVIQPDYLERSEDREVLRRGLEIAQELATDGALKELGAEPIEPTGQLSTAAELNEHIDRTLTSMFHPVGTCRMGRGRDAVVDPSLRVHGVDGLSVADASIMPVITSANTNAPTIMIGERAAELLSTSAGWRSTSTS